MGFSRDRLLGPRGLSAVRGGQENELRLLAWVTMEEGAFRGYWVLRRKRVWGDDTDRSSGGEEVSRSET